MNQLEMLTPEQYCEMFGITKGNAAQQRYMGTGPKFIKIGRQVRYRRSDVEAWLDSQTRQQTGNQVPA